MKAKVLYVGMLCDEMPPQYVSFKSGVNVITGRSSTGKSALIDVFDYCFGSKEYTVPVGIIRENSKLFFTIFEMTGSVLVLAREPKTNSAYIIEDFDVERFLSIDWLDDAYFGKHDRYSLSDFLAKLKGYFGITITDVDEDPGAREWRGKKLGAPTARSFTSLMLQHQNLIANKHAIFYRFDQKEKREQVIEHLKIFLGFVDQKYFLLKQKLSELVVRERQLRREIPRKEIQLESFRSRLADAKFEFELATGKLSDFDIEKAVISPKQELAKLREQNIGFVGDSEVSVQKLNEEQLRRSEIVGRLRELQLELADVRSAMSFSERYALEQAQTVIPKEVYLSKDECPMCHAGTISVEPEANKLSNAIDWLNGELRKSSYRMESYLAEQAKLEKSIVEVRGELKGTDQRMKQIRDQITNLKQVTSQYQLAVRTRVRMENILEECSQAKDKGTEVDLLEVTKEINRINSILATEYDINTKMVSATERIATLMNEYGKRFDFEGTYRPINLRFSLDDFELWHVDKSGEKVFLRSMGSGANWLSCHIVLFLALHRYFCELGEDCLIPPVLFLDQPSQVYFPSLLDGGKEFDAEELASKDTSRGKRTVDADMKAVTELFEGLILFCDETETATGIRPQIIVTDHADNLKLSGTTTFESLVRRRWRGHLDGFIDLNGKLSGPA